MDDVDKQLKELVEIQKLVKKKEKLLLKTKNGLDRKATLLKMTSKDLEKYTFYASVLNISRNQLFLQLCEIGLKEIKANLEKKDKNHE